MRFKNFRSSFHLRVDEGQAIVEYALLLALITVVAVGTLTAVGEQVAFSLLDTVADRLADVVAGI
jgi:Flp pilus assembly pilin Flp